MPPRESERQGCASAYCGWRPGAIDFNAFTATTAGSMMTSQLFTPIALRGLTLANRIVVAPMCQYSAIDGSATDWHILHLCSLSVAGPSLLIIEATGGDASRPITPGCIRP